MHNSNREPYEGFIVGRKNFLAVDPIRYTYRISIFEISM